MPSFDDALRREDQQFGDTEQSGKVVALDLEAMKLVATNALPNKDFCGVELSPDDVLALIAEVERLQTQVEAVKKLHSPFLFGHCIICPTDPFPCKTIRLLGVE